MSPPIASSRPIPLPLLRVDAPDGPWAFVGPLPWALLGGLPGPATRVFAGPPINDPLLSAMPGSLPGLARATAGALLRLRPRRVFATLELLPTEYRDLLFLLPPDTELNAATLDLRRPEDCAEALGTLLAPLGGPAGQLPLAGLLDLLVEQEAGSRPSGDFWHWLGGLGASPDLTLRPPPPRPLPRSQDQVPVLLLGRGLLLADLHDFLEEQGAFVVHDEEPVAEALACLARPEDFAGHLEFWRRLEGALEAGRRARAAGAIFVHEAFSGRSLEEPLYGRRLGLPLLSLPVEEPGPLDGHLRLRVQAFLELLRGKGVRP